MEVTIIKTNGKDPIFKSLTQLLDEHLTRLNGETLQHGTYDQFNTTDHIQDAYVLMCDHIPVGCGAFKPYNEECAELKRIYLKEEYRHLGLATKLIQTIENDARKYFKYMILESATTLKGAHQLYYKLGYQLIDNFEPFTGLTTSLCMKKELSNGN